MAIRGLIMTALGLLWAMIAVLAGGRFLALLVTPGGAVGDRGTVTVTGRSSAE